MDPEIIDKYELVVGLEVHAQLRTLSKAFSWEETTYGNMPNTNISVLTLAHPGTLPKANEKIFDYAIKMGLACQSTITMENIFSRKNYFYPDLPKGYQITQDKTPICKGGEIVINIDGVEKKIKLTRIHLEEDAGKSLHIDGEEDTFIDLNRAGVPLIEIVTEPDIRSAEQAGAFLTEIRKLVRYLEVCDGNMEEGSLRCDANISVRLIGSKEFGTRVEVKNMNSIRNVKRAINYEMLRQIELIENGIPFHQETRNFDAVAGVTLSMREKESMNDYRYFPEPDLTPVYITESWIDQVKKSMPLLPRELYVKFTLEYGLSSYDTEVLIAEKEIALYYEEICRFTTNYKSAANWVTGPVKSFLNERTLAIMDFPVLPKTISEIILLVDDGQINHNIAVKKLYPILLEDPAALPLEIAEKHNLLLGGNEIDLEAMVQEVLRDFPEKVKAYREGKKGLLAMFMGQLMKKTQGKADPKKANQILLQYLEQ